MTEQEMAVRREALQEAANFLLERAQRQASDGYADILNLENLFCAAAIEKMAEKEA